MAEPAVDKECSIVTGFVLHSQLHKELAEEYAVVLDGST
jgi:hypothetical protein